MESKGNLQKPTNTEPEKTFQPYTQDNQRGHSTKKFLQEKSRWRPECFHCGQECHFQRKCLQWKDVKGKFRSEKNTNYDDCATKSGQPKEDEPSHSPGATNNHVKGARGAYLKIIISRKCHWALLDTGGEVSIAPKSVVHDESIFPSTQSLRAANGSSINVVGKAVLPILIGDKLFPLHCLVAENVSEIILGLDWLNANSGVRNFQNKTLSLNGETFSIKEIEEPNERIMKLSTETVVPGRSEMNLNTETVYSDLWKHDGSWVTKPCLIDNTVLVARTLVADRTDNVVLRVVNVGSESVILQKGLKIGQLEEYEDPSPIIEKESNDDGEKNESAWMRTILDQIPRFSAKLFRGQIETAAEQIRNGFLERGTGLRKKQTELNIKLTRGRASLCDKLYERNRSRCWKQ